MNDENGYRYNVAIVVLNNDNKVLIAKIVNKNKWQFPQGGIDKNEEVVDAMYRELEEEIGLGKDDVSIITKTTDWLYYDIPIKYRNQKSKVIGQKQIWFLLKLNASDNKINLTKHSEIEFDDWAWIDYWESAEKVIDFKKDVYKKALTIFQPWVFDNE
ncbi:Adenosine (5')-pentaphospho-(5'')-adenosine pyrophosphohydrolase [hydrothermal vent metagenome]|uniref:Adenosine (5')-pentaphospho-(5'')-adenosine pyrophosphohydrolase n=1 Tax=hydrothermal vent metagenome TaxID=652676 RepID=A0A1W1C1G6_9ZZZZ